MVRFARPFLPFAKLAKRFLPLWLLLLAAAALRFYGLDWDGALGAHPDERYIVGVAQGLRCPDMLNPFRVAPDFAYGHLPVYLLAAASVLDGEADPLVLGRGLAALFDVGTVALTFGLGRRVYGYWGGLLAAAFVASMVLHVQQAHFYTADVLLVFFVVGTLLFAARLAQGGRGRDAWLAGLWAGLALGAKASAVLLLLPLGTACLVAPGGWRNRQLRMAQGGAVALAAFALVNPFALLAFPTFWQNVATQSAIARGLVDVPYTRQFHDAWPYLYPVIQQLRWGMGYPLGAAAFGGLVWSIYRAVREVPRRAEWVLLAWVLPGFAFFGALYAKFPRYLLPLAPILAICAARLLIALHSGVRARRRFSLAFIATVLSTTFLWVIGFLTIYQSRHPWLSAADWFQARVPEGAAVAFERWDHPLPLEGAVLYELPIFEEDEAQKWATMEETLAKADYVVIASRRGYATLAGWPERYPLTARYYEQLFGGELGFEVAVCFSRHPRLGSVVLTDDPTGGLGFTLPEGCLPDAPQVFWLARLDESFVVYDHPLVVILRRAGARPDPFDQ